MIMISIDGNRATSHTNYPDASEVMTKAELESIADQFDYSIQPKEVDRAVVEEKLAAAEADGIPLALRRMLVLKASQPLGNSKEEGASAFVPLCLCFPPSYQVYRVLGSASV